MQDLTRKKTSEEITFYDIQQAFNAYWKDKKPEKGKGYKPFKRWEYFMETRAYPSGRLPALSLWQVIREKQQSLASSQAAGIEWVFTGPTKVSVDINTKKPGGAGRIDCIAFHPSDSLVMWAGAPSGGIWKTTDGGRNWTPTGDQLAAIGISDIVVDRKNPNTLYVATGDGDSYDTYSIGIIKSTDGGLTWVPTSLTLTVADSRIFRRLLIHPLNNKLMLAASSNGIYKTTDAWNSYTRVSDGHFKDLEFKPGDPSVVYAASHDYYGNAKIYRSTDMGDTFQESISGMTIGKMVDRIELAVSPAHPEIVYALCCDAGNSGFYALYKSSNSGASWTKVYGNDRLNLLGWSTNGSDIGGQGWYDLALAVSPGNANEIYVGGVNIWRSSNGGTSWTLNSNWYHDDNYEYVHADHHALLFSPHGEILFSGNDGGIYKTYDDGKNWTDISDGLGILQTYRFGLSATDADLIMTGNQDNGSIMIKEDSCYEVVGGDGMECFIDYTNSNIIYATSQNGALQKSVNKGISFTSIKPSGSSDGSWVTPFVMHPSVPSVLYAAYNKIYRSVNGGKNWIEYPVDIPLNGKIKSLAIAPGNDQYIYAASNDVIIRSTDGGNTWTNITLGLPTSAITAIAVSPYNPRHIWVTFSSYTANAKAFYSGNGGDDWENYSTGLPNVPVNCLVYQKNSHGALYAGTDIGVYYRDEQLSQWTDYSGNLPNVIVNDLEIDYASSLLKAATYGRGIWQTSLNPVNQDILRADFAVSHTKACVNGTITVDDRSLGNPTGYQWSFGDNAIPQSAGTKGPHTVYYTSLGEKSISLSVTRESISDTELKSGILEVETSIDFEVSPDIVNSCNGSPVAIYSTGNYSYNWSPSEGIDTLSGNPMLVSPEYTTAYKVTATHGNCSAQKNVTIMITSNDDVCNAILLNKGENGPFDNDCATKEDDEPVPPPGSIGDGCQTQDGWCNGEDRIDNSLWLKFFAPKNGLVSIESDGFDNQIAVYASPSCNDILIGNYVMLAANDDFPSKADYSACIQELSGLTPDAVYWIQVDGSYGGVNGTFYLTLNDYPLSGIDKTTANPSFSVSAYPNPSVNGIINIYVGGYTKADLNFNICNINGETVYSETCYNRDNYTILPVNLSHLPKGIYLLEVQSENNVSHHKIIIP
ncbi:MAG: T9SS type A sorting domain-containing protein [Bacteroidales bacterium]|nr:T9SS type A sorting domain-containing protein [Bacteroidales bacterium]